MPWIDNLTRQFLPKVYARQQVGAMLEELEQRQRPGEAALYDRLDRLNAASEALDPDYLSQAHRKGQLQAYPGAEKSEVRQAIARRQQGFALQLAQVAFLDGCLDGPEQAAIHNIVDQHPTRWGACGDLPRLGFSEAKDLELFAQAPSDSVRSWMLEVSQKETVGLESARDLGEMLLCDGRIAPEEKSFAKNLHQVFGVEVASQASLYLRALGCSEPTPALLDEARSLDYGDDHWVECGPGNPSHLMALREAVQRTRDLRS